MFLGPSLSGVDQVGRSGGLIQTRRLTCEVASLDRTGGSAAPYLSLGSAEEALPGPLHSAPGAQSHRAAQTAQQTQHLRLYSLLYCLMENAAKHSFVFAAVCPGFFVPPALGGGVVLLWAKRVPTMRSCATCVECSGPLGPPIEPWGKPIFVFSLFHYTQEARIQGTVGESGGRIQYLC